MEVEGTAMKPVRLLGAPTAAVEEEEGREEVFERPLLLGTRRTAVLVTEAAAVLGC